MGCTPSHAVGMSDTAARKASHKSKSSISKKSLNGADSVQTFPVDLTDRQRSLVRSSWDGLRAQAARIGMELFHEIFRLEPSTKNLFRFSEMNEAQLQTDPIFRGHAVRFMQAIGAVIDNLDSTDGQLQALMLKIGARHTSFDSFEKDYFSVFSTALVTVLESYIGKERFQGELKEAWAAVIQFMLHEIRTGYIKTCCQRASEQAQQNGTVVAEDVSVHSK